MAGKYAIETAFNLIDKITRPMSNIDKQAKVVNRSLKNMYTGAEKATERFGRSLKSLGGKMAGALGLAGILNINKVVGFLTKDITNAVEYQTALAKVGTIANATAVPLDELSKHIIDVSTKTGVASNAIAESVYNAIASGIPTAKAAAFVETATKAAIAGFSDEATVIDGLTSVLNAYGLQAEQAIKISDQMLLAQNLGKTSFNDMANSIGKVIPYAAHLGMSTDELFASIATLTGSGALKTTDAMASMRAALTSVLNPSKEAAETARRLGVDFSASALQAKGFTKFIDEIAEAAGGNQNILARLFGSDKADTAIRILTSTGAAAFSETLEAMKNSMGATDEAFAKMMDTPEKRWAKVMNTARNAGINLGNSLLPIIERVTDKIGGIADSLAKVDFSKYTGSFEKAFRVVEFFASALLGAVKIAWTFRGVIFAALGVLGVYYGVSMLIVGAAKLFAIWEGIKKAAIFASTLVTAGHTAALATLKAGTLSYLVVDKAFTVATGIRNFVLGILTGGTLAQTAATASMAVATGTATTAQWLLNAAMTANPIGLIIVAVGALIAVLVLLTVKWDKVTAAIKNNGEKVLAVISIFTGPFWYVISMIKEVFNNWNRVKEAFAGGDILAGIKKVGAVLLSGILAPLQGLLEILSYIPGLGHLAGKGAEKIASIRNSLLGEDANITAKTKQLRVVEAAVETPEVELDLSDYEQMFSLLELPDFGMPDFSDFDFNSAAGQSRLHGVIDISNGAVAPPFSGTSAYTASSAVNNTPASATLAIPETVTRNMTEITAILRKIDTTVSGISIKLPTSYVMPGTVNNITNSAASSASAFPESVTRNVFEITAILRKIDANIYSIVNTLPELSPTVIVELAKPETATRMSLDLPRVNMNGNNEDSPDYNNPREIAPITQAERMAYSVEERIQRIIIEVAAEKGTAARIIRAPRGAEIELVHSGGNL